MSPEYGQSQPDGNCYKWDITTDATLRHISCSYQQWPLWLSRGPARSDDRERGAGEEGGNMDHCPSGDQYSWSRANKGSIDNHGHCQQLGPCYVIFRDHST